MKLNVWLFVTALLIGLVVGGAYLFQFLETRNPQPLVSVYQGLHQLSSSNSVANLTKFQNDLVKILQKLYPPNNKRWIVNITMFQNDTIHVECWFYYKFNWDLYNAAFYSMSLCTAIGFGNIYTVTDEGRLFTCLFAICTIPINGVWLKGIVDFLLDKSKWLRRKLSKSKETRRKIQLFQLLIIAIVGAGIFLLITAVLWSKMETNWTYLDSFYFSVFALLLVGLGDLIVGLEPTAPIWYHFFIFIWIWFGLGFTTLIVGTVADIFKTQVFKTGNSINAIFFKLNTLTIHKVQSEPVTNRMEFESGEIVDVQRCVRWTTFGSRKDLNLGQPKMTKLSAQFFCRGPSASIDYAAVANCFNKNNSVVNRRHSY